MQEVNELNSKITKVMSKKNKVFIAQFLSFAFLFIVGRYGIEFITGSDSIWISLGAAVFATVLAPQFKVFDTQEGQKVYMRWIFIKGVKELKW